MAGAARRTMWAGIAVGVLGLAGPASGQPLLEWAEWIFDAELASAFESNVNRASSDSEEEWELRFQPSVRAGRFLQVGERTRLLVSGRLAGDLHGRFEDLNAVDVEGELAVTHKLGLGDAPWIRVAGSGGYREVRDDPRSGPHLAGGLLLGKRFSPRLDATLGYRYARRYGDDGPAAVAGVADDVFDQEHHTVSLDGRFLVTDRLLLTAGFAWRYGDFDSNAQGSRFDVLAREDVDAVALDGVFGGWVYRVSGDGYTPFVRINYGLGDRWSVGLGYRFRYAEGGGLEYRNHAGQAVLLYRY